MGAIFQKTLNLCLVLALVCPQIRAAPHPDCDPLLNAAAGGSLPDAYHPSLTVLRQKLEFTIPDEQARATLAYFQGRIGPEFEILGVDSMSGGNGIIVFTKENGKEMVYKIAKTVEGNLKLPREVELAQRVPGYTVPHTLLKLGPETAPLNVVRMEKAAGQELIKYFESPAFIALPAKQKEKIARDLFIRANNLVDEMHARGVAHLDLTPGNLFVEFDKSGNVVRLKVIDFGTATLLKDLPALRAEYAGQAAPGTPKYMWEGMAHGDVIAEADRVNVAKLILAHFAPQDGAHVNGLFPLRVGEHFLPMPRPAALRAVFPKDPYLRAIAMLQLHPVGETSANVTTYADLFTLAEKAQAGDKNARDAFWRGFLSQLAARTPERQVGVLFSDPAFFSSQFLRVVKGPLARELADKVKQGLAEIGESHAFAKMFPAEEQEGRQPVKYTNPFQENDMAAVAEINRVLEKLEKAVNEAPPGPVRERALAKHAAFTALLASISAAVVGAVVWNDDDKKRKPVPVALGPEKQPVVTAEIPVPFPKGITPPPAILPSAPGPNLAGFLGSGLNGVQQAASDLLHVAAEGTRSLTGKLDDALVRLQAHQRGVELARRDREEKERLRLAKEREDAVRLAAEKEKERLAALEKAKKDERTCKCSASTWKTTKKQLVQTRNYSYIQEFEATENICIVADGKGRTRAWTWRRSGDDRCATACDDSAESAKIVTTDIYIVSYDSKGKDMGYSHYATGPRLPFLKAIAEACDSLSLRD